MMRSGDEEIRSNGRAGESGLPWIAGEKGRCTRAVYTNLSTGLVLLYFDLMEWRRVGGDENSSMNCIRIAERGSLGDVGKERSDRESRWIERYETVVRVKN